MFLILHLIVIIIIIIIIAIIIIIIIINLFKVDNKTIAVSIVIKLINVN